MVLHFIEIKTLPSDLNVFFYFCFYAKTKQIEV